MIDNANLWGDLSVVAHKPLGGGRCGVGGGGGGPWWAVCVSGIGGREVWSRRRRCGGGKILHNFKKPNEKKKNHRWRNRRECNGLNELHDRDRVGSNGKRGDSGAKKLRHGGK